ncbi:hypothetical protein KI387_024536, partial [Taxus chinensis]
GCDASVLIDSTPGNIAEKDAPANNPSLRGFEVIAAAKAQLEAECPATVSCADILAFAARDSAKLASPLGLANWAVKGGRRDGKISLVTDINNGKNLPSPAANVSELTQLFVAKGLSQEDMVLLSGAHTIGVSHCNSFLLQRLYNFNSTHPTDPSLDPNYAAQLKAKCPSDTSNNSTTLPMETQTPDILDNNYYKDVQTKRGLFISDATLVTDPNTANTVRQCASSNLLVFWPKFSAAMARLAN